jgi:hypothetical protein
MAGNDGDGGVDAGDCAKAVAGVRRDVAELLAVST